MGAETNAGRDVDADLVEHVAGESDRVVARGHGRPHIESRAWWLDRPAEAVQRVSDQAVPALVDLACRSRLVFSSIESFDTSPLHRLEDAGVNVGLELADQSHQVGSSAH